MGVGVPGARRSVKRRRTTNEDNTIPIDNAIREAEGDTPLSREGVFYCPVTSGTKVQVIEQADGRWAIILRQPYAYELRLVIDNSKLAFHEIERAFSKAYKLNGTIDKMVREEVDRTLAHERAKIEAATPPAKRGPIVGQKGGPSVEAARRTASGAKKSR